MGDIFNAKFKDKTELFSNRTPIPNRNSFYNEIELNRDRQKIKAGQPVIYTANYVKEHMSYATKQTQLLTVGILQSGLKVSVLLTGIEIYMDVYPSEFVNAKSDSDMQKALDFIESQGMSPQDGYRYLNDTFKKTISAFRAKVDNLTRSIPTTKQLIIHNKIFNIGVKGKLIGIRLFYKNISDYKNVTYDMKSHTGAYMNEELFVTTYSKNNMIDVIAARYDVYFGAWMKLDRYTLLDRSNLQTKAEFNISIDIKDFAKIEERDYAILGINGDTLHIYKSLLLCLDIETTDMSHMEDVKSENNNKGILSATNAVFNIGCVVSLESEGKEVCHRINIINTAASKYIMRENYKSLGVKGSYTIVASSLSETLLAFIKIMAEIRPDFVLGYNSLDFDIPQLLIALRVNNLYDLFYSEVSYLRADNLTSYKNVHVHNGTEYHHNKGGYTFWSNMKTTSLVSGIGSSVLTKEGTKLMVNNSKLPSLKIKSQNKDYHEINIPGLIMLDVMLVSWKKYPDDNNKGGMNYYLKKNGLKPKLDVPYYKIWIYYQMSRDYDIIAKPHSVDSICIHGQSCAHIIDDSTTCDDYIHYFLGEKRIDKAIYDVLDGKSLIDNLQKVVEYCSYDAEGALTLIKIYSFMMEKRKFCKLVNLTLDKVIYRADGNKVENGLRKTLYKNGFSYLEETIVLGDSTNPVSVKRIMDANPNMFKHHIKYKAPRNKGALVNLYSKGKIKATFNVNGKEITKAIPIDAVDFASLYPSIIMAYNLCNTTITFDFEVIKRLQELDPGLQYRTMKANDLLNDSDNPDETHEYFTKYYGIKSFKDSEFYIISHGNDRSRYGIYAKFLGEYFDVRANTKKKMGDAEDCYKAILEKMMKLDEYIEAFKANNLGCDNIKAYLEKILFTEHEEYRNSVVEYSNQFGEQLAVKVVMNTMYGTLDYVASPIYSPLIARIVTYYGRHYLQLSNKVCKEEGKTVVYNDTDSTYFHHNPNEFMDIITRYANGEFGDNVLKRKLVMRSIKLSSGIFSLRKRYTEKAEALGELLKSCNAGLDTQKILAKLQKTQYRIENLPKNMFVDRLNARFAEQSGGPFLKQVYEETLYPAIYCMLKKYFGLIHINKYTTTDNYTMKDILFRGLKVRTANCTRYEKDFSLTMFKRIIEEDDTSIKDIVFQELDKKLLESVNYNDLTLYENTARYKSNKNNKVSSMVKRITRTRDMIADSKLKSLYRTPFELENVYFICTKNNRPFCIMGRKNNPNKQELFEYTTVVEYLYQKHLQKGTPYKEVDLFQYVLSVAATCAQTLSYIEEEEFGYEKGIDNDVYVKRLANYVRKYCKSRHACNEESAKIIADMSLYKSYIRGNKDIFNLIIDKYCGCDCDPLTKSMIAKMINVSNKLKFSTKLANIANYSFIDFGIVYDGFFRNENYGREIDEEYIAILRKDFSALHDVMEGLYPYLDLMRETIVDYFFSIMKSIVFDGLTLDDIPIKQISFEDMQKLSFCEHLFRLYCGSSALTTGTIKFYYTNKKIEFVQLN